MKNQLAIRILSALLIVMLAFAALPITPAYAAACTFTSVAGNINWNAPASWVITGAGCPTTGSAGAFPGNNVANTDNVVIISGSTVTLNVSPANPIGSLTINAMGANGTNGLTMGANNLTASSVTITGANQNGRNSSVTISTGTLNVTGNVSFAGTANQARLTFTGAGTLNIGGNLGAGGTFTASTGTVNFNGSAAQTAAGYTYNVLKSNNAVGVTMTAASTIPTLTVGDVTANSVFSDGGFQVTSTGTLNLTSGTFKLGAANATTWPAFGTNTIASGTTVEYASAVAQTVSNTPTYQNLTISGAGTKAPAAAYTVNGTLTIASGATLDEAGFTLTLPGGSALVVNGTLDFTNATGLIRSGTTGTTTLTMGSSGIIRTSDGGGLGPVAGASLQTQAGGAWNVTSISSSGTVEYYRNATSAQTITDRDYNNLIITGATQNKTWALGAARTINGNLTVNTGAPLILSGAQVLNVKGNWSNSGAFTAGTGTVAFNGTGAQAITGANTWNILSVTTSTARTVTFQNGVTQTVSNSLTLTGAAGQLLTLASSAPPATWLLNAPATQSVSYVSVSNSNAGSGTTISAGNGTNTDGGNNTNWVFTNATTVGLGTAVAASSTSINVSMPYTSDGNGNNTYTVDYKLSSAGGWTNWATNAGHVVSPYTTTITGLSPSTNYDVRVTYNDADGVNGTNPQTISNVTTPATPIAGSWTNVYSGTGTTVVNAVTATSTSTCTAGAGSNRVVLVAFSASAAAGANSNFSMTVPAVTFGGVTVNEITSTKATADLRPHAWIGYIKEANIPAGAQSISLSFTKGGANNSAVANIKIFCATYTNVDQTSVYSYAIAGPNAALQANSPTISMNIGINDQAILFTPDSANTTVASYTPASYSSTLFHNTAPTGYAVDIAQRTIPSVAVNAENTLVTWNATGRSSILGVSLKRAPNKIDQTITVGTAAPGNAAYNSSFSVDATSDSGLNVAITTAGGCSGSGTSNATITMTSSTVACVVHYNQTGNATYNAAPEVTSFTTASLASQTITFGALGNKTFGDAAFTVSATGGASGNAVTFGSQNSCNLYSGR